ncbi:SOS cell division inhibitor [Marinobacter psychrophilus]|jgi:flagellar protein FliT|uniref:SOS cell division inhibitor n=1 Tax=Marinobacter psychrophilus TaxID=330734 RepID=UPI001B706E4F|nr:SOS cell division inhibitor [Marinobacter psychrophilus]MBQ0762679.1 SOS cell division inhibitor [Marinobacter psychrophilus]MBQ0844510.1 SOS cell division inhibitor [Marinobacter psychrophilus]
MAADHPAMAHLDQLLEHMHQALKDQDWELISRLSPEIKPAIEPVLEALEQGQLPAETVRSQLQRVQQFVDAADSSAHQAKAAAELELKGVNRNNSAAKAYHKVSSSRP